MKNFFLFVLLISINFSFSQNSHVLGEKYYEKGEYEKATQIFKKLYTKNPFNTTYLSRLISCYQETEKFIEVENLLKNKLKQSHNRGFLYVHLGYNYERKKQKDLAKLNYELALKYVEKMPTYGSVIAFTFKEYNLLDYAVLAFNKAMAKNKNLNYGFQIAQIYGEKGDLKKMIDSYIALIDKKSDFYDIVLRYVSLYITGDSENEANILLKEALIKKSNSNPKNNWNSMLSWLFTQQKEYDKALLQEKALYYRNPSDLGAIFQLGKIALENKNYDSAKACFDFILQNSSIDSEIIDSRLSLAKISIATNDNRAESIFKFLINEFGENENTIKIQVAYADFLTFQKNDPVQAKIVLEKALSFAISKFDKAKIKLKLGDVLIFTGQYNKALICFSQVQTKLKNHELAHQARFKVAQTSYFKGDFSWAKIQLKVLKGSTTQLIANNAVDLYLTITDNESQDSIPSGLEKYAKADLLAFQNKISQAIDTLNLIKLKFKGHPIEDEALFKQAELYTKQGQYDLAITNYEKIINLGDEGILTDDALHKIASLYHNNLNNKEKASEYYQKIIFNYPSSIYLVDARKNYRKIRGDTF